MNPARPELRISVSVEEELGISDVFCDLFAVIVFALRCFVLRSFVVCRASLLLAWCFLALLNVASLCFAVCFIPLLCCT